MENEQKLSTEVIQKGLDPVSFFSNDGVFVVAFKKTEKLVSAVYMITNLFGDLEPMKWSLRKKSGELLSFILSYKDTPKSEFGDFSYNAKTKVLEIVSLLEVSLRGGLISQMNYSILHQEFLKLIDVITPAVSAPHGLYGQTISKAFFNVSDDEYNEIISGKIDSAQPAPVPESHTRLTTNIVKDKIQHNPEDLKRSNRQNVILGLVRKKKEITIKDVSHIIKDCSEKTIQRELLAFIVSGVLKKTGERRWSKYSLVNA